MTKSSAPKEPGWTAKTVRHIKCHGRRTRDTRFEAGPTAPRGFGVRISTEGGKPVRAFVLVYRIHGRQRWLKLGMVDALTLAEAHAEAKKQLRRVANGEDP